MPNLHSTISVPGEFRVGVDGAQVEKDIVYNFKQFDDDEVLRLHDEH